MKKIISSVLIISVGVIFTLTSCGGGIGGQVKGDTKKTEGWIDGNTFRIAAVGIAKRTLTNKTARRASSKRAAILNAQYQVIEKFKGSKIEGASGMSDFEMTGIAIAQELKAFTKGGSVYKCTWNEEDDCEIIYEVKGKNLKKKASSAEWK